MIQLVFCLTRLPSFTHEAFLARWHDVHGPLVRSHAAALGIRRYVQVHTLPPAAYARLAAARRAPVAYDGVAELWFDSLEAMQAAAATPEGRAAGRALLEDERAFIDLAASPIWIGTPRVLVG
ncbi:MAG: EthD domain-containing protein [Burkholderiales bacterium]